MAEQAQKVGERIAYEREKLGWSRPELARQLEGVATGNDVYRWENGKHVPRSDTLEGIAKLFGITVADLYQGPPSDDAEQNGDLMDSLTDAEAPSLKRVEDQIALARAEQARDMEALHKELKALRKSLEPVSRTRKDSRN